jgi:hypothetical protein
MHGSEGTVGPVNADTGPRWVEVATAPSGGLGPLLVRRGGYAVGLVEGAALVASKVDGRSSRTRSQACGARSGGVGGACGAIRLS